MESTTKMPRLFELKMLSVRPHTAAVERLFSSLAFTKTKSRSQLGVEKLKRMAVIRTRIRVEEEKRKPARSFPSNKRVLNHPEEDEEREDETVNEEIVSLKALRGLNLFGLRVTIRQTRNWSKEGLRKTRHLWMFFSTLKLTTKTNLRAAWSR